MRGFVEIAEYQRVCEKLAEAEEQIAWLRDELTGDKVAREFGALRAQYDLVPSSLRVLLRLYRDAEKFVSTRELWRLLCDNDSDEIPDSDNVKVHVCYIRRALGRDVIETAAVKRHRELTSYRLTQAGAKRVLAAFA